jgi:hypothetical protein
LGGLSEKMKALKRIYVGARIIVSVPIAIAISPFGRRTALFLSIFAACGFALVFFAGFSTEKLLRLLPVVLVLSAVLGWKTAKVQLDGPQVYDKAKYHYDGDYPKELSRKQAFVHTGMFVGWLIDHDMIADDFLEETKGFKERKITGAQIYEAWDGSLSSQMLTEEGNRFASDYFDIERGKFLNDYDAVLVKDLPSQYYVIDTWENYELIKQKIDQRFNTWKKRQKA